MCSAVGVFALVCFLDLLVFLLVFGLFSRWFFANSGGASK